MESGEGIERLFIRTLTQRASGATWNPVKELKVSSSSGMTRLFVEPWNPVKELKALRVRIESLFVCRVESGEGIESRLRHLPPALGDHVESGEGIES